MGKVIAKLTEIGAQLRKLGEERRLLIEQLFDADGDARDEIYTIKTRDSGYDDFSIGEILLVEAYDDSDETFRCSALLDEHRNDWVKAAEVKIVTAEEAFDTTVAELRRKLNIDAEVSVI